MGKGKLIIIESGSDASGKATQSQRLYERLISEGKECLKITFPDYASDSSALVKMYFNGDFGKDPNDVSPYMIDMRLIRLNGVIFMRMVELL